MEATLDDMQCIVHLYKFKLDLTVIDFWYCVVT